MTTKNIPARRGRGRPASFDRQDALGRALKLFWEQGYEGTSFDQLTLEMGIGASTFYNAFGSKEQLYDEAVDAYLESSSVWFSGSLSGAAHARQAFAALLEATVLAFTTDQQPAGCMISLQGTHLPAQFASIRRKLSKHRADAEQMMLSRLRKGVEDGDLPDDVDIEGMAAFYGSVTRGMAVHARDGASADKLRAIAGFAMRAWP